MIITKQMDEGMNKLIKEKISCDREMYKESAWIKHEQTIDIQKQSKGNKRKKSTEGRLDRGGIIYNKINKWFNKQA